jgi:leader peptidase (prepilin peptidase)/N-methyltransferase
VSFDPIAVSLFAAFGLAFGSFLNVCIHRLPRRILLQDEIEELQREHGARRQLESKRAELKQLAMWGTRSLCPHCRHGIAWYDNIPLVSWLALRGRCRHCRVAISPRYLIVELLTAAMFVACYAYFGFTISAVKFCALSFFAIGLVFTDAEWKLLPDALTMPGIVAGLIFSVLTPVNDLAANVLPWLRLNGADWRLTSLAQSLFGMILGASFIYGAGMVYLRMRPDLRAHGREAMGLGDVKLMALIGAFLGATLTVFTMFAASMAGAVFGIGVAIAVWVKRTRRQRLRNMQPGRAWHSALVAFRHFQVPFGVFLASMAVAAGFFGDRMIQWYAGISGVMR